MCKALRHHHLFFELFKLKWWPTISTVKIKLYENYIRAAIFFQARFQCEEYPEEAKQAWRHVLLVQDVEIRDRLSSSQINKFLYQYSTEARPKQRHSNMVDKVSYRDIKSVNGSVTRLIFITISALVRLDNSICFK